LCDAVTADLSRLAAARRHLDEPRAHVVLPEVVTKDPLALAVRASDPAWADVVRWVHIALLAAEEVGLTASLAAASPGDGPAAARRLLERAAARGGALGLERGWARRAVAAVGHYGEMFERHLGAGTGVGLERGLNALWRDGGLHYPLPFR
jgi:general L-amino acid transport system substrate-binding protein